MAGKTSASIRGMEVMFMLILLFGQNVMAETIDQSALAIKTLPYAQLSQAVFTANNRDTSSIISVEGWKRIDGSYDNVSGFLAATYQNKQSKEIVIAFAATNVKEIADIATDALSFITTPAQYKQALDYASKIVAKYGTSVKVTGHSLGGGLAQYAAASLGLEAYTFNAVGIFPLTMLKMYLNGHIKDGKILNIVDTDDPLGSFNKYAGGAYLGQMIELYTGSHSDNHAIQPIINTLTAIAAIDNSTINPNGRPTKHLGAIVAMLTQTPAGGYYGKMYFTGYEAANLYSSSIRAESSEGYVVKLDGSSGRFKVTSLETPTGDVTSGLPVNVEKHELGHNSALEWGYWLQENHMRAGGADYYFENSYYIQGDNTPGKQMQALRTLNVTGTYKGSAYATYGEAPGGASIGQNMSGSFSADVNFSSRTLNNINISVSGNGHSATVRGTTAFFSGGSSTFTGNGDGSWKIDGVTAGASLTAERGLGGSFYGPNAKAIGGLFGMSTPANKYVTGAFQGTR